MLLAVGRYQGLLGSVMLPAVGMAAALLDSGSSLDVGRYRGLLRPGSACTLRPSPLSTPAPAPPALAPLTPPTLPAQVEFARPSSPRASKVLTAAACPLAPVSTKQPVVDGCMSPYLVSDGPVGGAVPLCAASAALLWPAHAGGTCCCDRAPGWCCWCCSCGWLG
eukprot:1147317-Pelagomonas_calceolata.AAC.3